MECVRVHIAVAGDVRNKEVGRSQVSQGNVSWLSRCRQGLSRWFTKVLYSVDFHRLLSSSENRAALAPQMPSTSSSMIPEVKPVVFQSPLQGSGSRKSGLPARPESENEVEQATAQSAFEQIQSYFEAKHIRFSARSTARVLDTGFRLPMGDFPAFVHVQSDPPLVAVYVHIPVVVPEDKRPMAAETVVRANYGLAMGRFELSMRDGALGFRAAMPLCEDGMSDKQFDELLMLSLGSAAKYHRAFARLIFGDDLSPAEVIAEIEMGN